MKKRNLPPPAFESVFDPEPARSCRVCGCTDMDCRGCTERTGSPCYWVEQDLCSACVERSPAAEPAPVDEIIRALRTQRFGVQDEKQLQAEIAWFLIGRFPKISVEREYHFDADNIVDFLLDGSIGVEVKIKGAKRSIFRQCERYCQFDAVKIFILITNLSMGFPQEINGKPCYVVKLGHAWL